MLILIKRHRRHWRISDIYDFFAPFINLLTYLSTVCVRLSVCLSRCV